MLSCKHYYGNEVKAMHLGNEFLEDLELLNLFNLETTQGGIKIHHEAAPERIAAAKRLFDKGIITLKDGGYLTPHGIEAAQHTQSLLTILRDDIS
jgi:uncharacterized protein (TIGR02647 family)